MGLGSLITVSLADARIKALDCRRQVLEGGDPLAARVAAVKAITFRECAEAYIAEFEGGWRNPKHREQWTSTLATYVFPIFGALPAAAIDTALVMKAVQPIWAQKTETASRVRGRVEAVLDWAAARGYRQGENPARWRGHLEHLLPQKSKIQPVEHHAALPYAEIGAFVAELRQREGVAARALEFLILTAAGTSEVIGARWSEIDEEARLWTVPAGRMKGVQRTSCPAQCAGDGDPGGVAARQRVRLHRPGRAAIVKHGDAGIARPDGPWRVDRARVSFELFRLVHKAHRVPPRGSRNGARARSAIKLKPAYRRGDLFEKRRPVAEAWARFCTSPAGAGEVVPLRRNASAE
jgi:integrase